MAEWLALRLLLRVICKKKAGRLTIVQHALHIIYYPRPIYRSAKILIFLSVSHIHSSVISHSAQVYVTFCCYVKNVEENIFQNLHTVWKQSDSKEWKFILNCFTFCFMILYFVKFIFTRYINSKKYK